MSGSGKTLAVTGGTGFVGQHLLRLASEAGYHVRALTRGRTAPLDGIDWVEGSLDRPETLRALCEGADAVIHIAGLIKGSKTDFSAVNTGGTAAIVAAAEASGAKRFIHISTLAAREPGLSNYGGSKAAAEEIVRASSLDWTIIRPPAVYGPGDRETLELFKMAKRGFVALPPKGRFSLIHVEDLCRLMLACVEDEGSYGKIFEPDDEREEGWDYRHFARTLGRLFGKRAATLHVPKPIMRSASRLDTLFRRKKATLTADRVSYFCHPDWVVAQKYRPPAHLWQPQTRTPTGLKETAEWYAANKWL